MKGLFPLWKVVHKGDFVLGVFSVFSFQFQFLLLHYADVELAQVDFLFLV
jgi:hypothetical protein